MARAPFQVLTIPFIKDEGRFFFAIFQRIPSSGNFWQWISGGGEDDEQPVASAIREANEEAKISDYLNLYKLDSMCSIQKDIYKTRSWGEDCFVIPEYSFALEVKNRTIIISKEHQSFKWVNYDEAMKLLKWDSNKTALWELNQRIDSNKLKRI